jgi:hypothetical protein
MPRPTATRPAASRGSRGEGTLLNVKDWSARPRMELSRGSHFSAAGVANPRLTSPNRNFWTMISRWSAGTSVDLLSSAADVEPASYRTIMPTGKGNLRAGVCHLPMDVRAGSLPLPLGDCDASTMVHLRRRAQAIEASSRPAYTSVQTLENGPKYCHFVPLFGTPGAPLGGQAWRLKSRKSKSLGHEMWVPGRCRHGVA